MNDWPPPPTFREVLMWYGHPDNPYAHPPYVVPSWRDADGHLHVVDPTAVLATPDHNTRRPSSSKPRYENVRLRLRLLDRFYGIDEMVRAATLSHPVRTMDTEREEPE